MGQYQTFIFLPFRLSGHGNQQDQEVQEDLDPLCFPVKKRKKYWNTQNTCTLNQNSGPTVWGLEKLPPPP